MRSASTPGDDLAVLQPLARLREAGVGVIAALAFVVAAPDDEHSKQRDENEGFARHGRS